MNLAVRLALHLIWITAMIFFKFLRGLSWRIMGTGDTVIKNYRNVNSYKDTAHVLSIWARHKFDVLLEPSGKQNFLCVHSSFQDPEYVLQDHISLYYVDQNEAVFVEVEEGIDVSNSENGAFYRVTQFELAKRIVVVPMHVFHKLGEKVGKSDAKLIFLHSTGRCGSTLITQVFEETGKAVALSEPDALNATTQLKGLVPAQEVDKIMKHTIYLLCKPNTKTKPEAYVIKSTPPTIAALPDLLRLFPQSYHLFLYRDGLATIKSIARAANNMPMIRLIYKLGNLSPKINEYIVRMMGLPSEQFKHNILSPLHFSAIVYASIVREYINFYEKGYKIVAINYEDIILKSEYSFKKLFSYCELAYDKQAVEVAFSHDSQRKSPLSMDNLKQYKLEEFTEEVKTQTDDACDQFGLPKIPEVFVAPGTITLK